MTRIDWLKKHRLGLLVLILLTISLPALAPFSNPAGAQPMAIFGGLALMGWIGVLLNVLGPAKYRVRSEK